MNRVLFREEELGADGSLVLRDRRAAHISRVLKAVPGQALRLGVLNGPAGTGVVLRVGTGEVELRWEPARESPMLPAVDLLLALPRPKAMKRLWAPLASLGVGRIVLTNAARVERHYFDTHWLSPSFFEPLLIEGLEQSGDTRLPEVRTCRRLKPFVEDELDGLFPSGRRLLAHPAAPLSPGRLGIRGGERLLLAVGPEGGWTAFELELFAQHGFTAFSIGWRALRSDTACIALLAVAHTLLSPSGEDPPR